MNKKNNSRKGATLAELIIVLAVLVIAATMVVSFSSMMHGAQGISNERFEAMQDVTAAESIIEGFVESNSGLTDAYLESVSKLSFGDKFVMFNNGFIVAYNGEDSKVTMELEHIESITFAFAFYSPITNETYHSNLDLANGELIDTVRQDLDAVYYCTINYSVDKTNYTYTFCVNPYAGE